MSLKSPAKQSIDGSGFRVGIAAARYNAELVEALLEQICRRLKAAGVKEKRLDVVRVPGSNELPTAVQQMMAAKKYDVCIAIGVIIRGDTKHYELVAGAATDGLMEVSLDAGVSVINGVIVAENEEQAEVRCRGKIDKGAEFAQAALEMAALKRKLSK